MTMLPSFSDPGRRPRATRVAGAARRLGSLLRAIVALAALAALVGGLPWALWHFVGWPLPDHLPSRDEVETTLLRPMSTRLLLAGMTCVLWLVWFAFLADVARATAEAVSALHRPAPRRGPAGPLHTVAGVLVGTIVLTFLGNRMSPSDRAATLAVAEASWTPPATASPPDPTPPIVVLTPTAAAAPTGDGPVGATAQPDPGTVVVRLPHDGIYDSLWRIAYRTLGDGARWPEIYALNEGVRQPDGRALTVPQLIRPGWILRIPAAVGVPTTPPLQPGPGGPGGDQSGRPGGSPPPDTAVPGPTAPPTPTQPPPSATPPATTPPPTTHAPPATGPVPSAAPTPPATAPPADGDPASGTDRPDSGLALPTGAFVALSLAALITVALFSLRRWRRLRYRPGSGDRDDLTIAPVVRELRIAHDHVTAPHDTDGEAILTDASTGDRHAAARARAEATARATTPPQGHRVVGTKGGQALALDLARTRGLGLVGPGATAALRALLVALLAERHRPDAAPVEVIVPTGDATRMFGEDTATGPRPVRLRLVAELDTALDVLEAELLTRARRRAAAGKDPELSEATLVLVASPTPHAVRRLQAILDNGSTLGMAGLLLGQWRPGATARVRADGTVAADTVGDTLTGARLFTMPPADSGALLDLLHDADEPAADDEAGRHPTPAATVPASPPGEPPLPLPPESVAPATEPASAAAPEPPGPFDDLEFLRATRSGPDESPHPSKAGTAESGSPPAGAGSLGRPPATTPKPPASAETLARPPKALALTVLGGLHLLYHRGGATRDVIEALAPKQREAIVYLALHPRGVARDTLSAAVWPDAGGDRPYNRFHATVSRLRAALRKATDGTVDDLIVHHGGQYALRRDILTTDLWQLQDALATARRTTSSEADRRSALHHAADLYHGHLAADLDADWIEAPREALRRDVLDALGVLVRTLGNHDLEGMLGLLEHVRVLDPHNEATYRDIARVQARLGRHDAVPRTLGLLTTTLAEVGRRPSPETVALCEALQRHRALGHAPATR